MKRQVGMMALDGLIKAGFKRERIKEGEQRKKSSKQRDQYV